MSKTFLIFKHEFIQSIKKTGYLILTLIIPVLALLAIGIYQLILQVTEPAIQETPVVGYVNRSGLVLDPGDSGLIKLVPFLDQQAATEALISGEINEFIFVPENYLSTGTIERFVQTNEIFTPPLTEAAIDSFLKWNILRDEVPPELIGSIMTPLQVEVTRLDEQGRETQDQGNIGNIVIPGVFAFLLNMGLMFGTNSLISGLGEEKESRLIEVLLSSVSVRQLITGKILALGAAGLLQVLVWLFSAPLLLGLASATFGGFLSGVQIPANFIFFGILYFILGYLLFSILSVTLGGISPTAADGHNLSMLYIMAGFIPLWLIGLLINFPDSPIWIALSIFPITAPIQVMVRLGVSSIPTWQILTSITVMVISIILGLNLGIKVFRLFMLMYGKQPNLREITQSVRSL
jgi:ABC-2 type transport system permease protein